jgi:hypothetical protein
MALGVFVTVQVGWIPNSSGNTFLGQQQANIPGQGQTAVAHEYFAAQMLQVPLDFEPVPVAPGSEGSVTLANINAALTAAVASLAGATGTPLITPAMVAQIQGWASGLP